MNDKLTHTLFFTQILLGKGNQIVLPPSGIFSINVHLCGDRKGRNGDISDSRLMRKNWGWCISLSSY